MPTDYDEVPEWEWEKWARFAGWGQVQVDGMTAPEAIVGRRESGGRCDECSRWHPFVLALMHPASDDTEIHLFDSYEDAAYQLRRWIPPSTKICIWFQSIDGPPQECGVANRKGAISWLLSALGEEATT